MDKFWLRTAKDQWQQMINRGIKPQAVIIHGVSGVGKQALLDDIIHHMLCTQSDEVACGQCQSCRLNAAGHHPDLIRVEPENQVIKVAMIRQLTSFYTSTPHCSRHKLAVISDAHLMNVSAANALLKVLEEPPKTGTLFLLTDAKHKMLPTIRSRCIDLSVHLSKEDLAQMPSWLEGQGHAQEAVQGVLPLVDYIPLSADAALKGDLFEAFFELISDVVAVLQNQQSLVAFAKNWADAVEVEHLLMWQRLNLLILKNGNQQDNLGVWAKHQFTLWLNNRLQMTDLIIEMNDLIQDFVLNLNGQLKRQLMLESLIVSIKNKIAEQR